MLILCRCVFCKHEEPITGAVDVPMCPRCFSPMVAIEARRQQAFDWLEGTTNTSQPKEW